MYRSTYSIKPNDSNAAFSPEEWRIDMDDAWLVLWWCRQLGLTKSELEHAVRTAGTSIEDVKKFLSSRSQSGNSSANQAEV